MFTKLMLIGSILFPAFANAAVNVEQEYSGGFSKPDVFVMHDDALGVTCYVFDGGNNVTSSCIPDKDLKKDVDTK